MAHTNHHIYVRTDKKSAKLLKKKSTRFDHFVELVAFVYPLSAIPQLIQVVDGSTEGVSWISWLTFMIAAMIFLAYSVIHRIRPMIICYSLWVIIDGLITVAVLINS